MIVDKEGAFALVNRNKVHDCVCVHTGIKLHINTYTYIDRCLHTYTLTLKFCVDDMLFNLFVLCYVSSV